MTLKEKMKFRSIGEILKYRAETAPNATAYICIENSSKRTVYTYKEIYDKAALLAGFLRENGVSAGDRCVLIYNQNAEAVTGILACSVLGAVAVPTDMPTDGDSPDKWAKIVANCDAGCVLTNNDTRSRLTRLSAESFNNIPVYSEDLCAASEPLKEIGYSENSVLQYTSGSTSDPKGVVVTNSSLLNNMKQLEDKLGLCDEARWVSWIPYHHDMGLIAGLLTAVYSGCQNIFMSPLLFKENPIIWFEVITEFKGTHTVAPNFAYELLSGILDTVIEQGNPNRLSLDSLVKLISGSEPVRFNTLVNFLEKAKKIGFNDGRFITGYGLAEATLVLTVLDFDDITSWSKLRKSSLAMNQVELIDSGKLCGRLKTVTDDDEYTYLVGNGNSIRDNKVMILNKDGEEVPPLTIGEVCAAGGTVAAGYWNNPEATAATFVESENGEVVLHTGDAGFFGTDGELYITGRYKEIIVIRGVNYYPADIEQISSASHSGFNYASCVFSASQANEDSLVIVQEVVDRSIDFEEAAKIIRRNIFNSFKLPIETIVFTGENSVSRTQSGKIMHKNTEKNYLDNSLPNVLYISRTENITKPIDSNFNSADELRHILLQILSGYINTSVDSIDITMPFMQMGINSEMSIRIINQVNEIMGIKADIVDIFNYSTVEKFADYLYGKFFVRKDGGTDIDYLEEEDISVLLAAELES